MTTGRINQITIFRPALFRVPEVDARFFAVLGRTHLEYGTVSPIAQLHLVPESLRLPICSLLVSWPGS